ncbi:retinitis pigmentosa 1-like 1 protein, partial [Cyclospora cayetanensis]|uniref:Retinitis pigmentosa 1-like 1 protein n=1 Tax=Cyclospora cayetanensis TaxID=88456 RepID=A0A6P6S1S5_9EIME
MRSVPILAGSVLLGTVAYATAKLPGLTGRALSVLESDMQVSHGSNALSGDSAPDFAVGSSAAPTEDFDPKAFLETYDVPNSEAKVLLTTLHSWFVSLGGSNVLDLAADFAARHEVLHQLLTPPTTDADATQEQSPSVDSTGQENDADLPLTNANEASPSKLAEIPEGGNENVPKEEPENVEEQEGESGAASRRLDEAPESEQLKSEDAEAPGTQSDGEDENPEEQPSEEEEPENVEEQGNEGEAASRRPAEQLKPEDVEAPGTQSDGEDGAPEEQPSEEGEPENVEEQGNEGEAASRRLAEQLKPEDAEAPGTQSDGEDGAPEEQPSEEGEPENVEEQGNEGEAASRRLAEQLKPEDAEAPGTQSDGEDGAPEEQPSEEG